MYDFPKKGALGALFVALIAFAGTWLPATSAGAAKATCGEATAAPHRLTPYEMQASELCLINRVRVRYGLHPLVFNADLHRSATAHSVSMVVHDYFSHEGPGGSVDSRISRVGYLSRAGDFTIGEDIGGGGGRRWGSPLAVLKAWMASPEHRANILDPSYRDAGVGVSRGYPGGSRAMAATYTVDFGVRGGR